MADAMQGSGFPLPPPIPGMEPAPAAVQSYDFTSTKKFTGESMGVLDSVFTTFGRHVENYFAGLLRLNCAVRLMDIQEKRYADFSSMFTSGRVMAMATIEIDDEAQQPAMIYVSNNVVTAMMDRLMGGSGHASESEVEGFTEMELAVVEKINSYIIPFLNDAWLNYYPMDFTLNSLKHNPKLVTGISQQDLVVIVVLKIAVQDSSGQISLCLPSSALEKLFEKLSYTEKGIAARRNTMANKKTIFNNISESTCEVVVRLDDTQVTLKQLFNMQVGDIINLDKPVDSDAILCIEDVPFFRGELGVHRQRTALKIKDTIKQK